MESPLVRTVFSPAYLPLDLPRWSKLHGWEYVYSSHVACKNGPHGTHREFIVYYKSHSYYHVPDCVEKPTSVKEGQTSKLIVYLSIHPDVVL